MCFIWVLDVFFIWVLDGFIWFNKGNVCSYDFWKFQRPWGSSKKAAGGILKSCKITWLVAVYPPQPEKYESIGMMKFPIYIYVCVCGKIKLMATKPPSSHMSMAGRLHLSWENRGVSAFDVPEQNPWTIRWSRPCLKLQAVFEHCAAPVHARLGRDGP